MLKQYIDQNFNHQRPEYEDSLEHLKNNINQDMQSLASRKSNLSNGQNSDYNNHNNNNYQQREPQGHRKQDDYETLLMKKDYAKWYGVEDQSMKNFIYQQIDGDALKSCATKTTNHMASKESREKDNENNIFMKKKLNADPAFEHHKNQFFGANDDDIDPNKQYLNNLEKFFRGSTPNESCREVQREVRKNMAEMINKRKDIFVHDIFSNKPRKICSVEEGRLNAPKAGEHYEKVANDKDFKNAIKAFYDDDTEDVQKPQNSNNQYRSNIPLCFFF